MMGSLTSLGLSGYELGPGLDELIRIARLLRVETVEIWPQNLLNAAPHAVRDALERSGLRTAVVTLPFAMCLNHPDEDAHLRSMRDYLRVAHALGAWALNVKVGAWPARPADEALARLVPMLRDLADAATRLGLKVLVENQVDETGEDIDRANWSRSPHSLRRLLDAVDSPAVKATYDPGNFLLAGYEPFPLAYEVLRPHIAYVHVKDAALDNPRSPAPPGTLSFADGIHRQLYHARPVGAGAVNWAGLLARLASDDYAGVLMLDGFTPEEGRDDFYEQTVGAVRAYLAVAETLAWTSPAR
jgi:sugar phosphate isomerase/epimerase